MKSLAYMVLGTVGLSLFIIVGCGSGNYTPSNQTFENGALYSAEKIHVV